MLRLLSDSDCSLSERYTGYVLASSEEERP